MKTKHPKEQFPIHKKAVRYDQLTNEQVLEILNDSNKEDYEIKEAKKIARNRNLLL